MKYATILMKFKSAKMFCRSSEPTWECVGFFNCPREGRYENKFEDSQIGSKLEGNG